MADVHAHELGHQGGPSTGHTPQWEQWDGLASLDGHVALPHAIPTSSQETEGGNSAHTSRVLAALKFFWFGKPRALRGTSVVRQSSTVGFQSKLAAGIKRLGMYLHDGGSAQDDSQKQRRHILPRFSALMEDTYECVACLSNISVSVEDAVQVSCGHLYHSECLLQLVRVAMQSPSQFPPRCCKKPVLLSTFGHLLDAVEKDAYAMREMEQATSRRVYCSNPRCSRFLGPRVKQLPVHIYDCPATSCGSRTCARCKAAVELSATSEAHQCTHDPGHRAALQLGSRLGWVRCPDCEHLVERDSGCAHMRCICGAQFCYCCGAKWKTCSCVEWRCPAGDLELPPRGAGGGRVREHDLFAPLQEGGDIGGRLSLWAPPTFLPGERQDAWPLQAGADLRGARSRRERSFTLPQPMRGEFRENAQTGRAPSRGTPSLRSSMFTVEEDPAEGHIGSCLPFWSDSHTPSRGATSTETRRKPGRATSL
ncbi:hypothetical protein OH77DRAFT_1516988 [Trametes cingulata]|nr:hypothetical protein OH77DRAFT_1516988 [Trametes cingulata]